MTGNSDFRMKRRKAWTYREEIAPPLSDLFRRGEASSAAYRYWIADNLQNAFDIALHFAVKAMPVNACSALGARIGRFAVPRWHAKARERAEANLRELRPDLSGPERLRFLEQVAANQGRVMLEFSVVNRMARDESRVTLHGLDHLAAAKEAGAAIFVGTHLGNWELSFPLLVRCGIVPNLVYDPPKQRGRAWIARTSRKRAGVKLTPPGRAAVFPLVKGLKAGEPALIFCDEGFKGWIRGPLLGRNPHLEGNLAVAVRLAHLTGATICPFSLVRRGQSTSFDMTFLPLIEFDEAERTNENLPAHIRTLNDSIEPTIRANLDQWYFLDHRLPPKG